MVFGGILGSYSRKVLVVLQFIFIVALASCGDTPMDVSTPIVIPTDPEATATIAPDPSSELPISPPTTAPTLLPTSTPTPVPTALVDPSKKVFVWYGVTGGDGGLESDFYLGRGAPELLVYSDGTAIYKMHTAASTSRFVEFELPNTELCRMQSLISRIPEFNEYVRESDNPMYEFDDSTVFSDGAGDLVLQLNGNVARQLDIYLPYYRYLIPQVKYVVGYFEYFSLSAYRTYHSEVLLLWLELGRGRAGEAEVPAEWPNSLPALESLYASRVDNPLLYDTSHVILRGSTANQVFEFFGNQMKGMLLRDGGTVFYGITRPLLPHESAEAFGPLYPWQPQRFDLPFTCKE